MYTYKSRVFCACGRAPLVYNTSDAHESLSSSVLDEILCKTVIVSSDALSISPVPQRAWIHMHFVAFVGKEVLPAHTEIRMSQNQSVEKVRSIVDFSGEWPENCKLCDCL